MISLKPWLERMVADEIRPKEPHYAIIQLHIARFVIAIGLAFLMGITSNYFGANAIERPAIVLAGLIYGMVGAPYAINFFFNRALRSNRLWLRLAFIIIGMTLLSGPTLVASVWLALNLSAEAPWYSRVLVVGVGGSLVVAGWRELMVNTPQPQISK